MLHAAGIDIPEQVWAHGFVHYRGERFSKSAGTRLELGEAVERFGPDAFRYFLLSEIPWDNDGNFSWERFEERYAADLADGLGNLASRSLAMLAKYRDGRVPTGPPTELDQVGRDVVGAYAAAMDGLDLKGAAETAWTLVAAANQFIVRTAPWALAKAKREEELDAALAALARCLFRLAVLASPFIPGKSEELWRAIGQSGRASESAWAGLDDPPTASCVTHKPEGLFPRQQESVSD
jgi:methionyl-tRNA synthetase